MMRLVVFLVLLLTCCSHAEDSSSLYLKLKKLNVLGSVLYVAAHPDDENTQLLARLSKGDLYRTGYLSLTRGSGGQNLIGPELGEALGVIRTQELLKAREIDGCEQFFTSARDFGFSKHPKEALKVWGREKILEDVVRVIEDFEPDVIITRFSTEAGITHGHHTASAILAIDAYSKANWKAHRLVHNLIEDMPGEKHVGAVKGPVVEIDINGYSPLLGLSFAEIGALALSQNRTQSFGSAPKQNRAPARFLHLLGEAPTSELFDGIDTSWSRLNAPHITSMVNDLIRDFDFENPDRSVPGLLQLHREITALPRSCWRDKKLDEVDQLIVGTLGLELTAYTDAPDAIPSGELSFRLTGVTRAGQPVTVRSVRLGKKELTLGWTLKPNRQLKQSSSLTLGHTSSYGMVDFPITWNLELGEHTLKLRSQIRHLQVDPKLGPRISKVAIVPPLSLEAENDLTVFRPGETKQVTVKVRSYAEEHAELLLEAPEGWNVSPSTVSLKSLTPGEAQSVLFSVTAPKQSSNVALKPVLKSTERVMNRSVQVISYDHIPRQVRTPVCTINATCVDTPSVTGPVGYLPGSGDGLPDALRTLGYKVRELTTDSDLNSLKAVVLGIRALNTQPDMVAFRQKLERFAASGGVVVVNYSTPQNLKCDPFGLTITKNRVTDENSPVEFLAPNHRLFKQPNLLTAEDFQGWVQERGLYFASPQTGDFEKLLRLQDPDEEPLDEALLVRSLGQGYIVYNSLSLFRQLPAGVPGSYRLLVNMIELCADSQT